MADNLKNAYKVAFASTDGENVNTHYGRADNFYVYIINDEEGYDFLEERKVSPICMGGSHDISKMEERANLFSDCRYVVASRIGGATTSSLTCHGIIAMELPGTIEDAIIKVWKYNRVQELFC